MYSDIWYQICWYKCLINDFCNKLSRNSLLVFQKIDSFDNTCFSLCAYLNDLACVHASNPDAWYLCALCLHVKDLGHVTVTEHLPYMCSYFCHSLDFGCSPAHRLWFSAETQRDVRWGHMWPGLVPGEHGSTTLVLSVTQPVSQPVWGKKARGEKTHWA